MFVSPQPDFRLRWLGGRPPRLPRWFADETWVPAGRKELYAYARSGLYAFLDSLSVKDGTVLLPAYVPESAVWPFRETGFDIRYYPISDALTYPFDEVAERIREVRPDVVTFVHYLGFADAEFRRLVDVAREVDATVVEDCSRGAFSRDGAGQLLGSTGDAAMFSLHKTLPAPHGGLLVTREDAPVLVPPVDRSSEWSDLASAAVKAAIDEFDGRPAVRSLNGNGSHHPFEYYYERVCDPPSSAWPPKLPGRLSRTGLANTSPEEVQRARRERYGRLRSRLATIDELTVLTPEAPEGACPYGVAVRLPGGHERRENAYVSLRKRGMPVKRYIWPVEEGRRVLDAYSETETLRTSTLVFPTHQQMPAGTTDRLVSALESEPLSRGRSRDGKAAVGRR